MFTELTKDVIGYKKIRDRRGRIYLVTLLIHAGTRIFSDGFRKGVKASYYRSCFRKLRAFEAEVLEIRQLENNDRWRNYSAITEKTVDRIVHISEFGPLECQKTVYEVDEIVTAPNWSNTALQCEGGIHFFVSEQRALEY